MSDSFDIKPIFANIRVKSEPVDHGYDIKPVKKEFETLPNRRSAPKRKVTKKRKSRKRRKKPKARGKRTVTRGPVHRALMRQLGIDLNDKKPKKEFSPVVPEDPSLPDSDEKPSPTISAKPEVATPVPPAEDLLDSILEQQEAMFSQSFRSKRKTLTPEEVREKAERRRKRQEIKDEQQRKEEEVRRKQREIRDMERREKERKELEKSIGSSQEFPKRKSRFSEESPFVNAFEQKHKFNFHSIVSPVVPVSEQFHPQVPIPMTSAGAAHINPLALLQQNPIDSLQQNALLQQQIQLEYLAAANLQSTVNPLIAQLIQNAMPQPLLFPSQPPNNGLMGLAPPPPPPEMFALGNPLSTNSFLQPQLPATAPPPHFDLGCSSSSFLSEPPPPPALPDTEHKSPELTGKKAHVSAVASVVKPLADKYGKRYKLSTADYKKMCVKIVKKVAKYHTPPKPERIELLVEEYARYLHRKDEHHRKKR